MTPAATLAALANCASAAVFPPITTLVVGPSGVGDEVPCCTGGSIVVELASIEPLVQREDRGVLAAECPAEDVLRARIIVSRCVETVRQNNGYSGGQAPDNATFNAEGAALIGDVEALYSALKCCIDDLFDAGDIESGALVEATTSRSSGCAQIEVVAQLVLSMPCIPTP